MWEMNASLLLYLREMYLMINKWNFPGLGKSYVFDFRQSGNSTGADFQRWEEKKVWCQNKGVRWAWWRRAGPFQVSADSALDEVGPPSSPRRRRRRRWWWWRQWRRLRRFSLFPSPPATASSSSSTPTTWRVTPEPLTARKLQPELQRPATNRQKSVTHLGPPRKTGIQKIGVQLTWVDQFFRLSGQSEVSRKKTEKVKRKKMTPADFFPNRVVKVFVEINLLDVFLCISLANLWSIS